MKYNKQAIDAAKERFKLMENNERFIPGLIKTFKGYREVNFFSLTREYLLKCG